MSPRARLERAVPLPQVEDAAAACAYDCDRLGFAKDWERRFEPGLPLSVSLSRRKPER